MRTLVQERDRDITQPLDNFVRARSLKTHAADAERHPVPAAGLRSAPTGWRFSEISIYPTAKQRLQAKLAINQPGDRYELEADRKAEEVTRRGSPGGAQSVSPMAGGGPSELMRKCGACLEEEKDPSHKLARKETSRVSALPSEAPEIVDEVLRSSGAPLGASTLSFMERRFGHNFGGIRVHSDGKAAKSARAVGALAYTVGNHIVFGANRYDPTSTEGSKLLAHELTHTVQQGASGASPKISPRVARFTDTGHHIVEEAGLAGAGFSKDQTKAIEKGNVQRDYSQVGWIGNTALLCKPHEFGGYKPVEHFDNYMWDAVTHNWRTRGASALGEKGVDIGQTPIQFIGSQLEELANRGLNDKGLEHLGNAFHTVEDFFAHSNFVELVIELKNGRSSGATLITGNPIGPSQSVSRILEAITPPGIQEQYREQSEDAIRKAAPGTHTAMAHDDPTTNNYVLATRLAALVIQDLGTEVLAVMTAPEEQRAPLMRQHVLPKVVRYLQPPNPRDKWWESLTAADAGKINRRLEDATRSTPVTVNQCALSPLKNIEASKDSPLALPIGIAIPTTIRGNQAWFQLGAGVTRPFPFDPIPGGRKQDERETQFVVGAQIVGRF